MRSSRKRLVPRPSSEKARAENSQRSLNRHDFCSTLLFRETSSSSRKHHHKHFQKGRLSPFQNLRHWNMFDRSQGSTVPFKCFEALAHAQRVPLLLVQKGQISLSKSEALVPRQSAVHWNQRHLHSLSTSEALAYAVALVHWGRLISKFETQSAVALSMRDQPTRLNCFLQNLRHWRNDFLHDRKHREIHSLRHDSFLIDSSLLHSFTWGPMPPRLSLSNSESVAPVR